MVKKVLGTGVAVVLGIVILLPLWVVIYFWNYTHDLDPWKSWLVLIVLIIINSFLWFEYVKERKAVSLIWAIATTVFVGTKFLDLLSKLYTFPIVERSLWHDGLNVFFDVSLGLIGWLKYREEKKKRWMVLFIVCVLMVAGDLFDILLRVWN